MDGHSSEGFCPLAPCVNFTHYILLAPHEQQMLACLP